MTRVIKIVKMGFRKIFESKEIKKLRARVETEPDNPALHFNLGVAYEKVGRTDEAVLEFEATLKGNLNSAEAHYNLAIIYASMNKGEKAIHHIVKAGTLFGNKNDRVNNGESRRLSREYYRKFNVKPEKDTQNDSEL